MYEEDELSAARGILGAIALILALAPWIVVATELL
jgi:hypothetical protein